MTQKEKLDEFDRNVYESLLNIYETVEIEEYERYIGSDIIFFKRPKRDNPQQEYIFNVKVSKKIENFIVDEQIDLYNKEEMLKKITSCLTSTAKCFDYAETIESGLGIFKGQHISFIFYKCK